MTSEKPFSLVRATAVCLALAGGLPAQAQSGTTGSGMRASGYGEGYSILPYTRSGYAGINLGKPASHCRLAQLHVFADLSNAQALRSDHFNDLQLETRVEDSSF